jgi:8-oxo-dGTP pyrophosphatase MutT (NUDIX family)
MKRAKLVGIQYAALPYRLEGRQLWVMLVSSRGTGRWIIPKGWPMKGLKPQEAAAVEAREEAGIEGEISAQPIGSYRYLKEIKDGQTLAVQVLVFPLRVEGQAETFKEEGQRTTTWRRYQHAAGLVAEPALRRLILDFGSDHSANILMRGLRRYQSWRFGGNRP